jgi:hypothetical protein
MRPVKVASQDAFYDEMVGSRGSAPADTRIDFPLGIDEEIGDREDLLLLIVEGDKIPPLAVVRIILNAEIEIFGGRVSNGGRGAEGHAFGSDVGEIVLALRRREVGRWRDDVNVPDHGAVDGPIPAADGLVDDRHELPGPSGIGKGGSGVAEFAGEADADRPAPFRGNAHAWTNVIANPLDADAALFGGEGVEAHFEPVSDALRELEGFVFLVLGGEHAELGGGAAVDGEVAVQFDEERFWSLRFGGIDLDFVVVLSAQAWCAQQNDG